LLFHASIIPLLPCFHYRSGCPRNSSWSEETIQNVVIRLGYDPSGESTENLKALSANLADCAKHGADSGFPGFSYYGDTLTFFQQNRQDIIKNLELTAEELGEDTISMVRHFGVFRYDTPPSTACIGRAIWGTGKLQDDCMRRVHTQEPACAGEL
jgi:hypothetical protein